MFKRNSSHENDAEGTSGRRRSSRRDSEEGSSWEEVSLEEAAAGGELCPHTQALRRAIQSSDTYSPLAKQVLLNQVDGLEHTALALHAAQCASGKGSLSSGQCHALDHYREFLCTNMTMSEEFYSALVSRRVMSPGLAEEVKVMGTRRRQCASLLDLLKLLGDKAYSGFLAALKDTQQEFLVDTLKSDTQVSAHCPSLDRLLSVKTEQVILPISCYPKSGRTILMDLNVPVGSTPLLGTAGQPQSRMNPVHTRALIKNRVRLCRELFAEIIFDSLIEDEILNADVMEAIFLAGTRHRMNQVLLYILPFYGDEAFVSFVAALKKTGQDSLAILLEDYVLQNQDNVLEDQDNVLEDHAGQ